MELCSAFAFIIEPHHTRRVLNVYFSFDTSGVHAESFMKPRSLPLFLKLHLNLYIPCANNESAHETALLCRLASTFSFVYTLSTHDRAHVFFFFFFFLYINNCFLLSFASLLMNLMSISTYMNVYRECVIACLPINCI